MFVSTSSERKRNMRWSRTGRATVGQQHADCCPSRNTPVLPMLDRSSTAGCFPQQAGSNPTRMGSHREDIIMKQLAVRLTVFTSVCGGAIALAAQAAHARLAG